MSLSDNDQAESEFFFLCVLKEENSLFNQVPQPNFKISVIKI